jgi:hypothetical protein
VQVKSAYSAEEDRFWSRAAAAAGAAEAAAGVAVAPSSKKRRIDHMSPVWKTSRLLKGGERRLISIVREGCIL